MEQKGLSIKTAVPTEGEGSQGLMNAVIEGAVGELYRHDREAIQTAMDAFNAVMAEENLTFDDLPPALQWLVKEGERQLSAPGPSEYKANPAPEESKLHEVLPPGDSFSPHYDRRLLEVINKKLDRLSEIEETLQDTRQVLLVVTKVLTDSPLFREET